jgi:hypothetical protein
MELAKSAVLRGTDLGAGWATHAMQPDDSSAPDCAGQDYSRFTITGQAQTQSTKSGASVTSRVEVYESRADALGDFAVDARPRTASCEGAALARRLSAKLLSARQLRTPKIGRRSTAFRIVLGLTRSGRLHRVYVDVVGFVRDRSVASVIVWAPGLAPKGDALLAQTIDSRLQRVA